MTNPMLLPLVAAQAVRVRRRLEILPPASGPTTGQAEGDASIPLKLHVIGESTAAGCGASIHDEAFTGELARRLAARNARSVAWTVCGRRGATIHTVRHGMIPPPSADIDIAVLLIGVNDVLRRTSPEGWKNELEATLDALVKRARLVAMAGIPPFEAFPSLPRTLAGYLAARAVRLDDISWRSCARRPAVQWISSRDLIQPDGELFASDGFHPSSAGYQRWARAFSDRIASWPTWSAARGGAPRRNPTTC